VKLRFYAYNEILNYNENPFSGMLGRLALVGTYVSEEIIVSIIRVTGIGELGKTLVVTIKRSTMRRFLSR
jgi:hypothetical protein